MNPFNRISDRSNSKELSRMVEPLANYICATDQPKRALLSALAVLFHEVEATNRAALAQFRSFSEN
jgi:hypothetical protein